MCSRPPSSPTIVGSAVDTIVWSSDASSITSISAPRTTLSRGASRSAVSTVVAGSDTPLLHDAVDVVARRPRPGDVLAHRHEHLADEAQRDELEPADDQQDRKSVVEG